MFFTASSELTRLEPAFPQTIQDSMYTIYRKSSTVIAVNLEICSDTSHAQIQFGKHRLALYRMLSFFEVRRPISHHRGTPAAALAKMTRILCLVPPLIRPPLFILGFAGCSLLASSVELAAALSEGVQTISSFTIVMATAALGLQISPSAMLSDGWQPLAALLLTSIGLGAYGLLFTALLLG